MTAKPSTTVQKQRNLPWSKAVEIAWKQIRMRLSRSLLVTSGIVLAIAFLVAIQVNDVLADGMRGWIENSRTTPEFTELRRQRDTMDSDMRDRRLKIRDQIATLKPAKDAKAFDVSTLAGKSLDDLKAELGQLPGDTKSLQDALTASEPFRGEFAKWLADERALLAVREKLNAPQLLAAKLADNGVPTKPEDIAAGKLQQRWLLGLALLVAFVGILNAMLMSVTERFREIGTMKCLGALDSFIVKLFLVESAFQGFVGTVIGLILGVSISLLMSMATYGGFAFNNFLMSPFLTAVGGSALIGVVLTVAGAVWPAWQAAKMHPIEAMRVEA
jgi:cell division protein FtsX